MIAEALHSKHYPTYFALLWLVAKLGVSTWLLRLPSAIFGAIATALVVVIGREADKPRTGIAAGLLLALSPFDVQYGQEARSYTLVAVLILLALWGLVRIARESRRTRGAWLAYGGGALRAQRCGALARRLEHCRGGDRLAGEGAARGFLETLGTDAGDHPRA